MKTSRLEAFSDGVMAIIITIMILEMKAPKGGNFSDLQPLIPKFLSYILSFIYVGIYWNNHHHLFQAIDRVNGKILWANLTLLFTLSIIPLSTAWMGENHFERNPLALYGMNLISCAIAFTILEKMAIAYEGAESKIAKALHNNTKEYLSLVLYIAGITASFFTPLVSLICYTIVAIIWVIPDSRIEKNLSSLSE